MAFFDIPTTEKIPELVAAPKQPFFPTPTGAPIEVKTVAPTPIDTAIKNVKSIISPFFNIPAQFRVPTPTVKTIEPTPISSIFNLNDPRYQNIKTVAQIPSSILGGLLSYGLDFASSIKELATGNPLPKINVPALTKDMPPFINSSSFQQKYTDSITAGIEAKNKAQGWANMTPGDDQDINTIIEQSKKTASQSDEDIIKNAYKNTFLEGLNEAIMLAFPIRDVIKGGISTVSPRALIDSSVETVSKETLSDYLSGRKTAQELNLSPKITNAISENLKSMSTQAKATFIKGFDLLDAKPTTLGKMLGISDADVQKLLDTYGGKVREPTAGELPGYRRTGEEGGINIKGEPVGFGAEGEPKPKSFWSDITPTETAPKAESVNMAAERAKAGEDFGPRELYKAPIDQAIAQGEVRIVRRGNTDVYQIKNNKGDWINTKGEDDALARLNEPKVEKPKTPPKEKVYAPQDQTKLDGIKAQLENVRERLAEHPAIIPIKTKTGKIDLKTGLEQVTEKNILSYLNEGDFQDFKNPQLADTPAEAEKIKAKNAEIMRVTQNAFDSNPELSDRFDNPDAIREVIADYRNARDVEKTLVAMRNDLEQNLVPLENQASIDRQIKQNEKDIAIESRRRKLEAAQRKINAEHIAKEEKKLKIQTETLKPPEGRKLNTLNPKKSLDPETQKIYEKFSRAMAESKVVGLKYANQMPAIDKLGTKAFDAFEGGVAPWQWEIRQKFDALYSYAKKNGFEELGYETHYLPHIYKESPAQINSAIIKSLEAKGMTKTEIDAYMAGKKLSPDQSMHLKLNPFFAEYRVFKTYAEAATFGLSPKYTKMSELLGVYEKLLLRTSAARNLIEDLTDAGKIVPEQVAPQSWQPIKYGPRGIKGYWASPKIGNFIDGVFRGHENMGLTDTIMSSVAELSRFGQNMALSAGVPYTSVNFFTAGIANKELMRGNLKVFKDFLVSNSDSLTVKSLQNDYKYIEMMVRNGIPFRSIAGVRPESWESIKTKWGKLTAGVKQDPLKPSTYSPFFGIVGQSIDNVFGEKTFKNFLPLLYTQVFKDAYNNLIKQGVSDELAQITASRLTMLSQGITEDLGRSKLTQDKLTALFFAPVYRESIINVLLNIPRAFNPVTRTAFLPEKKLGERSKEQKWQYQYHFFSEDSNIRNPMYRYSRQLLAGLTIAFGVYNLINKKLNGNYTWDNPQGHEADIMVPLPGGQVAYIPFMPGFLAMPRSIIGGTKGILSGDVNQAFEQYGSVFSMVVKTGVDVLTNTNYFGNNIYQATDTRSKKIEKVATYIGLEFNHAYVKEFFNQIGDTPKPLYQSIITAFEIPIKFTTQAKINQGKFYDAIAAQAMKNSEAKSPIQDIHDQVQKLIKEGASKEQITALVKDFTPEDIKTYKAISTAQKSQSTLSSEQKMMPIIKKMQTLLKEGKNSEVSALFKDFTEEDKRVFKLLIKKVGFNAGAIKVSPISLILEKHASLALKNYYQQAFL